MSPSVIAVVATYRRPELVDRLLASLRDQAVAGVVLVDNGGDLPDKAGTWLPGRKIEVLSPGKNLGTGGGLELGMRHALSDRNTTHLWVLDDDALARPGALAAMLAAAAATRAGAVSPLVPDEHEIVKWFPGPLGQPAWDLVRRGVTTAAFQAACGGQCWNWNWATWASLLLTRQAVETVGWPRTDFWYQSTDIEYTLRVSARFRCVLAPAAVCPHLPPSQAEARWRLKEQWGLQNNAFLSVRLRHGWRALRHLPGNHYRYWHRHRHAGGDAARESWRAFWRGAVLGYPVGADVAAAAHRDG